MRRIFNSASTVSSIIFIFRNRILQRRLLIGPIKRTWMQIKGFSSHSIQVEKKNKIKKKKEREGQKRKNYSAGEIKRNRILERTEDLHEKRLWRWNSSARRKWNLFARRLVTWQAGTILRAPRLYLCLL